MHVQALGYVGVRCSSLEDWAAYGQNFLGMQRIVVEADGGQGIGFFGWEVADAAGLDAIGAKLEAHGTKVARGSRALALYAYSAQRTFRRECRKVELHHLPCPRICHPRSWTSFPDA